MQVYKAKSGGNGLEFLSRTHDCKVELFETGSDGGGTYIQPHTNDRKVQLYIAESDGSGFDIQPRTNGCRVQSYKAESGGIGLDSGSGPVKSPRHTASCKKALQNVGWYKQHAFTMQKAGAMADSVPLCLH